MPRTFWNVNWPWLYYAPYWPETPLYAMWTVMEQRLNECAQNAHTFAQAFHEETSIIINNSTGASICSNTTTVENSVPTIQSNSAQDRYMSNQAFVDMVRAWVVYDDTIRVNTNNDCSTGVRYADTVHNTSTGARGRVDRACTIDKEVVQKSDWWYNVLEAIAEKYVDELCIIMPSIIKKKKYLSQLSEPMRAFLNCNLIAFNDEQKESWDARRN